MASPGCRCELADFSAGMSILRRAAGARGSWQRRCEFPRLPRLPRAPQSPAVSHCTTGRAVRQGPQPPPGPRPAPACRPGSRLEPSPGWRRAAPRPVSGAVRRLAFAAGRVGDMEALTVLALSHPRPGRHGRAGTAGQAPRPAAAQHPQADDACRGQQAPPTRRRLRVARTVPRAGMPALAIRAQGLTSTQPTLTYEIGSRAPRAEAVGRAIPASGRKDLFLNRFRSLRSPRLCGKSPKIGAHGGAFFAARDAKNVAIHIYESLQEIWAPWARYPSIPTIYPRSCLGILGKS